MQLTKIFYRSVFLSGLFFISSFGQSRGQAVELGGGIGALNYSGDMIRGYRVGNIKPGVFGFYRFNFNNVVSTRISLSYGGIKGDDGKPLDPAASLRNQTFNARVLEAAATLEYNFLDFKHEKSPIKWSPYFFAGFGAARITGVNSTQEFNKIQPIIPFGLGAKYLLGKRYTLGVELGARKTFFDLLDGVSDNDVTNKNFQFGHPNEDDWYYFFGFSFSYIFYNIPCPFPYIPNEYMMRSKVRPY
ncbi:MAG: DUF6089 family protein [Cyclobacteriaceae bacterium]